jgi:protein-disulfide isomerase
LKQIEEVYKGRVEIVWKNMPLTTIHQHAMGAALAAEAAHNQGKFWEMHDKLFANQSKLEPEDVKQYAKELGLNLSQFDSDLQSSATKKRVSDDMAEASSLGITGTPAFFINGRYLNGAQPFESFAKIINAELQRLKIPIPSAAAGE